MHSNFVFTQTNFESLKDPKWTGAHWRIQNRVCWHYGEPQTIIHNGYIVESNPEKYKDYFHILHPKKPLYAMNHYSANELKTMARQIGVLDTGTRTELYARITDKVKQSITEP